MESSLVLVLLFLNTKIRDRYVHRGLKLTLGNYLFGHGRFDLVYL